MADKKSSPEQIIKAVYDTNEQSIAIRDVTNIVPSSYDEMLTSYINSSLEPDTVVYKKTGVIVAVVKFEYDNRGRLTRVSRQV